MCWVRDDLGERRFSYIHLDSLGAKEPQIRGHRQGASISREGGWGGFGLGSPIFILTVFSLTIRKILLGDESPFIAHMSMLCSRLGSSHVTFPTSVAWRNRSASRIKTLAFSTSRRAQHGLEATPSEIISPDYHHSLAREKNYLPALPTVEILKLTLCFQYLQRHGSIR